MRFIVCLIALLIVLPCMADESVPLLYSRTDITIMRKSLPPAAALPWQGKDAPVPPAPNPAVTFDVEVRDAAALYNRQGWFDLSGIAENAGVLMAFNNPVITPVSASAQYAPMDILLIDPEGKIVQIAPNIVLSQLQQEIVPDVPVLAFLFLKGGTCEKLSIAPGDTVEYKLFKKLPKVLSATPEQKPITPVVADVPSKAALEKRAPSVLIDSPIKE